MGAIATTQYSAVDANIRLAIGKLVVDGQIKRHSLIYFQDRLDVYMDTVTARYARLGQTVDFSTDPNVQHFEFMIAQEAAALEAMQARYKELKALLGE